MLDNSILQGTFWLEWLTNQHSLNLDNSFKRKLYFQSRMCDSYDFGWGGNGEDWDELRGRSWEVVHTEVKCCVGGRDSLSAKSAEWWKRSYVGKERGEGKVKLMFESWGGLSVWWEYAGVEKRDCDVSLWKIGGSVVNNVFGPERIVWAEVVVDVDDVVR
jgi:hypothetical protein